MSSCPVPNKADSRTSLDFNLGSSGKTIRDQFIFSNSGVTATATAWRIRHTAPDPSFERSELVRDASGIHVKDTTETIVGFSPSRHHRGDGGDRYDFVLFVFSRKLELSTVRIHPDVMTSDLDASCWLGDINPSPEVTADTLVGLISSGFASRVDSRGAPGVLDIAAPSGGVNALLL
ncbi:MAG: hypothetical protein EOP87_15530, partial [Verrucomicrobiaceae bacterium]